MYEDESIVFKFCGHGAMGTRHALLLEARARPGFA